MKLLSCFLAMAAKATEPEVYFNAPETTCMGGWIKNDAGDCYPPNVDLQCLEDRMIVRIPISDMYDKEHLLRKVSNPSRLHSALWFLIQHSLCYISYITRVP